MLEKPGSKRVDTRQMLVGIFLDYTDPLLTSCVLTVARLSPCPTTDRVSFLKDMASKSLSLLRRLRSRTGSRELSQSEEPQQTERAALTEVYRGENPEVEYVLLNRLRV